MLCICTLFEIKFGADAISDEKKKRTNISKFQIDLETVGASACSLYFSAFQLGDFARPLDYPERDY